MHVNPDIAVAGIGHHSRAIGVECVDIHPDVLHEGICRNGGVASPSSLLKFLGLLEPSIFETFLAAGLFNHEGCDLIAQCRSVPHVQIAQRVEKAIAVPGHRHAAKHHRS